MNRTDEEIETQWRFDDAMESMIESVEQFHERFNVKKNPSMDRFCGNFPHVVEEIGEVANEINQGRLDGALEELADVVYAALDILCHSGQLGVEAIYHVVNKNNAKTLDTHFKNQSGKIVKLEKP